MVAIHETAYPRLKSGISLKDLRQLYTPTPHERTLIDGIRQPVARFGFALQLKLFQRLGYFLAPTEAPTALIEHVAACLNLKKKPALRDLRAYGASGTAARHAKQIRDLMGVKVLRAADRQWLSEVAHSAAQTREALQDIINILLEELVHQCFELPGFTVLVKLAREARYRVNEACFQGLTQTLSRDAKVRIDQMLCTADDSHYSTWHRLKREPRKLSGKEARGYLEHVRWLQQLGDILPVVRLPAAKRKQFTVEARALDAQEMSRLKPTKRYALAVLLIQSCHAQALDDCIEILTRTLRSMVNDAKADLNNYLLERRNDIDGLIAGFRDVLEAAQLPGSAPKRIEAIDAAMAGRTERWLVACNEHLAYAGDNYLPFIRRYYGTKRSLLFNCLRCLDLASTSSDESTLQFIDVLKHLERKRGQTLELDTWASLTGEAFDDAWLPQRWRDQVRIKTSLPDEAPQLDKPMLELAIFRHIQQELDSGDLYVPHSLEFNDQRDDLVDMETVLQGMPDYCEQTGLPVSDAKQFVQHLKTWLTDVSRAVDAGFPKNPSASFENGVLKLKRHSKYKPTKAVELLDAAINERLQPASIVDVLTDAEKWLNCHKRFYPHSGNASRLENPAMRFITTVFCYGCNLGPAQTAKSIKSLTPKQVGWLNLKQASETKLHRAITDVINDYNKFDLPGFWGTGESASVDGTRWDLYEQNLLSEYHIRYGGYGGIGYYHISDKYIALFSNFITCGAYEGRYLIDGLMANDSDIQPDTVHGDTHSQSYAVFGLSHMLGIKLMPRIRNPKELKLYKPDNRYRYDNIESLFKGGIDFDLIERHLMDILQVVFSVRQGTITASTLLRRLGTASRKNKLYLAFKELGKVVRTVFLLNYISDVDLRKMIFGATNKSEEFHAFTKWLFFGNEGIIEENHRPQQHKIIKYNQLVANMVILYNVEKMTHVIKELQAEGWEITPEVLARLSPYRTGHINRYGDYTVDMHRKVQPLDFGIKIFSEIPVYSTG